MFILEPKKENIEEKYEIGDTFGVYITAIAGACITGVSEFDFEVDKFQWRLDQIKVHNFVGEEVLDLANKLSNSVTLLKYIGDNTFEEYYTGKLVRLFEIDYGDGETFGKRIEEAKKNPLLVFDINLGPITNEVKSEIIKTIESKRNLICDYFEKYENTLRKNLDRRCLDVLYEDWDWAEKEDKFNTFVKKR